MTTTNKFLNSKDYSLISYKSILKEMEYLYNKILKKKRHYIGSKFPNQVKIQWCRDWEFPWAIISSEVKSGEKVLDCGCGGSPLLYFLSQYGCKAYGVDINAIVRPPPILKYYIRQILDVALTLKNKIINYFRKNTNQIMNKEEGSNLSLKDIFLNFLRAIFKPKIHYVFNNLRWSSKDPKSLGFSVNYFKESLDNMHFKDKEFDKVFCISVIEHLPEEIAFKGMKEMARVLKDDGFLIVTLDHNGDHINPKLRGKYLELIKASGLELYGECDFEKPNPEDTPGLFDVIGFVLRK